MTETRTVTVNILDREYQIACRPSERDALHAAAEELDERMRGIRKSSNIVGLDRIAVMAALNLCHELQELQKASSISANNSAADEAILSRLRNKIDKALGQS